MIPSAHSLPDWFPILTSLVNKVPPNLDLSSAKITLAPFFAAAYALANPDGPDPAINKSQYSYLCSYLSIFFLIPPTSAFMAWLFLNENLTSLDLIGFFVATIGVYIATRD